MNRLKLWLYMLVVLGAGAVNLYVLSGELSTRMLRQVDDGLRNGVAALRTQELLLSARVGSVASLAARDPALLLALAEAPPPPPDPKKKSKAPPPDPEVEVKARQAAIEAASVAAVEKASAELGVTLPKYFVWAANPEILARSAAAGPESETAGWLREAAGGAVRRGYARFNDVVWYGTAVPMPEGGALAFFFPVDAAWAQGLAHACGCEVTIDAGTPQLITTGRPETARTLAAVATAAPRAPVGEGRVPQVQLDYPMKVKVPLLFSQAPAWRAQAVELTGVQKGYVVLAISTTAAFTPLAQYQWTAITVIVGLLLVGLLLGVLVRTEVLPQAPPELVAAADKIGRGDFTARAPTFAGALGTIAGALNKAAEAAQAAPTTIPGPDPFAAPPPSGDPGAFFEPSPAPAPPPPPEPVGRITGGGFEAALSRAAATPPPEPPRAPPAEAAAAESAFASEPFAARPAPRSTVQVTTVGGTLFGMPAVEPPPEPAAEPAAPPPEEDEETHWRAVHAEFLETRAQCGEPTDGLGFDRFKPKLQKNKDALMQKYGCRTVRFQVYVKEGKAALKATPVR